MPASPAWWTRRRSNAAVRSATIAEPLSEDQMVWMVGSPRTGSTWLLNLMGLHQRVRAIDEPLIGAHLGLSLGSLVAMERAGSDSGHARVVDRYAGREDYFFSDRYEQAWRPQLRELVLSRLGAQFRDLGGEQSSDYLVLKEPHGSEGVDVLMRAVPRSRVLALVRDGRDVLDSVLDGLQAGAWASDVATVGTSDAERAAFLASYANLWVLRTRTVLTAVERAGARGKVVRYEELLADTVGGLGEIYAWLGLPTPDDLSAQVERLAFSALPAERRGSGQFARAATPGLWREQLTSAEQQQATEIMAPALHALGYSP